MPALAGTAGQRTATSTPAAAVSLPGPEGLKSFTLAEVAKHNTPRDCWVIVRGNVYDVTAWVPRHPGGDLIFVAAGKDSTQLFDSYHPLSARKVLEKYLIGRVALQPGEALTDYASDGKGFYEAMRTRVDKYFKDTKRNPRVTAGLYIKSLMIFATIAATYWGAFYHCTSMPVCLLLASVLGVAMAEVGVSVMHDANHGAYSSSTWLCHMMGATLDLVGASSFMWRQQHVVGHHAYTNVEDLDPDIRVNDPDVRRVTPAQPYQGYQKNQHLYLGVLYGLLSLKSVLVDDFKSLADGRIGSVKLPPMTRSESIIFWGGKAFFATWFVAAPLAYSHHGIVSLLALWLLAQMCTGWFLAFMFQVAHVSGDVQYLPRDPKSGKVAMDWAASQVATTADFCHGSWFWTHLSGGLNYQVVHHLFPGINHVHYPAIAPLVQQTCAEYGIKYHVYTTFWEALGAHFKHLKAMGAGAVLKVPSLATVG